MNRIFTPRRGIALALALAAGLAHASGSDGGGSAETGECVRATEVGRASDPEGLGRLVAAELMVKGAGELLGLGN